MPDKKPTYQELEKQIIELKKQQKERFLATEKHNHGLFKNMPEMFQVIELIYNNGVPIDYYYRNVNPAFEKFIGKNKKLLIGKRAKEIFSQIKDEWLQTYHKVIKTGEPISFENFDEDSNKYFEKFAWKVSENKVAIIFNDITERKQLELNLNLAKERLEDFFNLSPSLMMIKNSKGKIIKVNKSSKTILGYTEKEILNIDIWSLVHPEDLEKTKNTREYKKKNGGKILNFSNRYKHKNGKYKTLEWQASIIKDGFTYAFANDVTERNETLKELQKAKEEKLKQSENRVNMLLKASEDMITTHQPNGKYLYYNGPSCYPIESKDIVGKMPNELFNQQISKTLLKAFEKVEKTGKSETIEILLDWLGEKKWFSEYIYPVKNEKGELIEIVKVCRDIHKRKLAEKELFIAKEKAERKEKDLLVSNKEYQKLNKELINSNKKLSAAKRQIEKNESNLKTLINTIPDLIWQKSVEGEFIFANTRVEDLLGAKEKDIIGKTDYDFVSKEIADSFRENDIRAMHNGIPTVNEEFIIFPNNNHGTLLETKKVPVFSENKEIIGILGIGRDITEKRKAEQEIESQNKAPIESEKKLDLQNKKLSELNKTLNQAQELSHIGSWQWNMETDTAEWSDEMYNIYGVTKDTFYPSIVNVSKTVIPEDLFKLEQAISSLLIHKMFVPFEFRIKRPSGEIRTLITMSLEKKTKQSVFGVTKDITERKQQEKYIIKTNLKLEKVSNDLIEAQKIARVGSWLLNPTNYRQEWSEEMFFIWGFNSNKKPPEHKETIKRIHDNDIELFKTSLDNAKNHGIPYDIEFRVCIPYKDQKVIRSICKPILNDHGKVVNLSGTNQDITEQKTFEEAQVNHQRLKAIGEMSSSIAHDFNNSLQQMIGNLEIVKIQNELPENALNRLNNISSIINDVSDRISALQKFGDPKKDDKDFKLVNLNTLIKQSLDESRPIWKNSVEKKGFKTTVVTDLKEIPKIKCNSGELKSAIYNLIKNSIDAMPEGGEISIKTDIKQEGVFATFSDTGIGMSEETKLKVFQPFFSTKGFKLGRGLGMSGVYSTVKKHNGEITVKSSEISKGTTFEIILPINE